MRPVFVGDVHGCIGELDELLEAVGRRVGGRFELLCVGDLVNRGPGSLAVLERLRALGSRGRARAVLGNHEIALLSVFLGVRELRPSDTFTDVLGAPDAGEWIDWIRSWPLAITGTLGPRDFALVHAAVAPGWSLEELRTRAGRVETRLRASRESARELLSASPDEDPDAETLARMVRCRSVDDHGRWSPQPPARAGDAWHARWLAQRHGYGVVHGHWAQQGLHVAPGLRGLDTGCVHHGRERDGYLTAWLPRLDGDDPFAVPDDGFVRVRGHRCYWPFGAERTAEAVPAAASPTDATRSERAKR